MVRLFRAMAPASLRMRITLSVTVVLLVLIAVQAYALVVLYEDLEQDFIDSVLDEQMTYAIERSRTHPDGVLQGVPNMAFYRLEPDLPLPDGLPAEQAALPVGNHELHQQAREFHVAVRDEDGVRFILRYDESDHEARVATLTTAVVAGATLLGLMTVLVVYAVTRRMTRGLERLAERVQGEWEAGTLTEPEMEDELRSLAQALEAAAERQRASLARERDFTANLSHELRTPLSAIRSDAEILALSEHLPEPVLRRARRMVIAVDRITDLAQTLLSLAREAEMRGTEIVPLRQAVLDAWQILQPGMAAPVALNMEIAASAYVEADPERLQRVIINLLDNALKHAGGQAVEVLFEDARLAVRDRGPGLGVDDPMQVFERFYRSGEHAGHGLGLALVRHICMASGWQVFAANRDGGGAEVGVIFLSAR